MSLIDLIKGQLGQEMVSQAATQLGESESGVSKAIGGLLPAVLGGLADNANKPGVLDAVTGAASSGLLGNLLGGSSNNSLVTTVLSSIFGDKMGGLLNLISGYSGVSNSSASSLLNMVTGATLGSVGKYAADNNLDASGITNLLGEQKGLVSSLLPAGLSLGTLGLGSLFGGAKESVSAAASATTSRVSEAVSDIKKEIPTPSYSSSSSDDNGGGGSFLKWLLPLLLLGLAAWFIWKQCDKKEAGTTEATTDTVAVETDTMSATTGGDSATVVTTAKESTTVTLPDGKTLNAYKGGVEDQLVNFLKSDEYKNATEDQLKTKWFNFDNLNFEFGTTKITKESQVQVDNLKAILAAFPDAKAKIGAYTDKVGSDTGNLALSQKRADAVKAAVGSAQVIEAKGYGEQFATVDEKASDKEREADRKTAIRLTK